MDATQLSRLRWRCRRGMRELDVLLLRYLDREFPAATPSAQSAFERLLSAQDPEILDLLAGRLVVENAALNEVIQRLLAQSRH
ncbi:MAG: succinate dehydrogenase assembly factor 2 family protein [Chromatiales bacterium]|nr:MAG: succinate dehydrogenase assembly factor 2 family protein [Chromatiales bacterium]